MGPKTISAVTTILAAIGGIVAALGLFSEGFIQEVIGGIVSIVGIVGNLIAAYKAEQELGDTKVALNDMTALASVSNPDAV